MGSLWLIPLEIIHRCLHFVLNESQHLLLQEVIGRTAASAVVAAPGHWRNLAGELQLCLEIFILSSEVLHGFAETLLWIFSFCS